MECLKIDSKGCINDAIFTTLVGFLWFSPFHVNYLNGTCPISVVFFACQAHFRELTQFDECAQMIFFGGRVGVI